MHYIRFLKPPRLVNVGQSKYSVKFVITIATDLGDDFFPFGLSLLARVRSDTASERVLASQRLSWNATTRSLAVDIPLGSSFDQAPCFVDVGCSNVSLQESKSTIESIITPVIIPVRSTSIKPCEMVFEAEKAALRRIHLSNGGVLSIVEDTANSIARHIWDAGVALAYYLDGTSALSELVSFESKQCLDVIELGTGCGIVGLAISALKPNWNILLTDVQEVESFIKTHNISSENANVSYYNLDWTQPIPNVLLNQHVDVIIAADCTYNPDSSPFLVQTIDALERNSPGAKILIASKTRHASEAIFFDVMKDNANFLLQKKSTILSPIDPETDSLEDADKIDVYLFSRPVSETDR